MSKRIAIEFIRKRKRMSKILEIRLGPGYKQSFKDTPFLVAQEASKQLSTL